MTNRWKRLTALMLILLTLLNAGSALAAEEFWKWGDVYEEKLMLSQPTEVTDLQVFKDELYFIYGDLLLKCHEPDDTPAVVYNLKNLLPENVGKDTLYDLYEYYLLFTDGDALYIFVTFMQRIYRIDFENGEAKPVLYATLDYSSLPELNWDLLEDDWTYYKSNIKGKIVKIGDKIYMLGSDWSYKTPKLISCLISFSLETGHGEILAYNDADIWEVVSWQENPEWASTLLVYYNYEEWEDDDDGHSYVIDKRKFASYNLEQRKAEETLLEIKNLGLENQLSYDLKWGFYTYNPRCTAFAWDAENRRFFFLHDDIAWFTDGTMPARGLDRISMEATDAEYGFFWKGAYYFKTYDDGAFVCDMSIFEHPEQYYYFD